MELTKKQIEHNKKEYASIQDFMNRTYNECLKLGIGIRINIKTGRFEWHKQNLKK